MGIAQCYDSYFVHDGVKYASGTRIQFTKEFYDRHRDFRGGWMYVNPFPSIFLRYYVEDGKEFWHFTHGTVDDIVWERDVAEIVTPIYYVVKTDKDRIREKKEQGQTLAYIWPGTIVYILAMIFITVFNERVFGWIMATILYNNYCYEQLSQ